MSVSDTRKRIVKATRDLHEEVGPVATTIKAIAERAGVQRLTVYRHFSDDGALIRACSADWREEHPLPDPVFWSGLQDSRQRFREALRSLYGYYERGAPMLERILEDEARLPELAAVMEPWWDYLRELAGSLAAGWGVVADKQRLVRAAVGHAVQFGTWRSLTAQDLTNDEAVGLMERWVAALSETHGAGQD